VTRLQPIFPGGYPVDSIAPATSWAELRELGTDARDRNVIVHGVRRYAARCDCGWRGPIRDAGDPDAHPIVWVPPGWIELCSRHLRSVEADWKSHVDGAQQLELIPP
jgi:hypothetical protein